MTAARKTRSDFGSDFAYQEYLVNDLCWSTAEHMVRDLGDKVGTVEEEADRFKRLLLDGTYTIQFNAGDTACRIVPAAWLAARERFN